MLACGSHVVVIVEESDEMATEKEIPLDKTQITRASRDVATTYSMMTVLLPEWQHNETFLYLYFCIKHELIYQNCLLLIVFV